MIKERLNRKIFLIMSEKIQSIIRVRKSETFEEIKRIAKLKVQIGKYLIENKTKEAFNVWRSMTLDDNNEKLQIIQLILNRLY